MPATPGTRSASDPEPCEDLCDFCLEVIEWIGNPDKSDWQREFEERAQSTCEFCEKIMRKPQQAVPENEASEKIVPLRMEVTRMSSRMQSDRDLYSWLHVQWIVAGWSPWKAGATEFALWTEKDDPASRQFVFQPPILGPSMEDICRLTHRWLNECNSLHTKCRSTTEKTLPTRVLQLSGSLTVPVVKLIETKNMKGARYCALSHCWGPINKQPLRTTRDNYQHHLSEIPFEKLPLSFRDTVTLARGLDIKYVWIDSLCIIQDDKDDWQSQAKEMGKVYRNATLVVAAAGARDSTGGLFIAERPFTCVRQLPYIVDGVISGSFNISPLPEARPKPIHGILNTRAWALQERYLARRTIQFMPGEMYWKCRHFEIRERGIGSSLLEFDENISWLNLLRSYSLRKLTQPEDRIHALRGIIDEMQKNREDEFLFECGIWSKLLYKQILWIQKVPIRMVKSLDFPTWTWASIGGSKIWGVEVDRTSLRQLPKYLDINNSRYLVTAGHLTSSLFTFRRITCNMTDNSFSIDFESKFLPTMVDDFYRPSYAMRVEYHDDEVLGIAVFDRDPLPVVKCFFVALQSRTLDKENDEMLDDITIAMQKNPRMDTTRVENVKDIGDRNVDNSDGKRLESKRMAHSWSGSSEETKISQLLPVTTNKNDLTSVHESFGRWTLEEDSSASSHIDDDKIASRLRHLRKNSKFVYWALLLEPVGEAKYERVGITLLYPQAIKVLNMEFAEIEIM